MAFSNPFAVTAAEIAALNEHQLVIFANLLIWAEGKKLGVPAADVKISLRIHDPDGGADAETDTGELAQVGQHLRLHERLAQAGVGGISLGPRSPSMRSRSSPTARPSLRGAEGLGLGEQRLSRRSR